MVVITSGIDLSCWFVFDTCAGPVVVITSGDAPVPFCRPHNGTGNS